MKNKKKDSIWIEFIKSIAISLVIVYLLTTFMIKPIRVNGSSMYPTLHDQSFGFSNVMSLKLFGLKRFDIAVVYDKELKEYLVKRVIGLPGETIQVLDGVLLINNQVTDQPFLDSAYVSSQEAQLGHKFTSDFGPILILSDQVFLMGDNRPHSTDSRVLGAFKISDVLCKDAYILWPLDQISFKLGD